MFQASGFLLVAQGNARAVVIRQFFLTLNEIIHGENIFQKFTIFNTSHTSGLACAVQLMRHLIGFNIKIMIIGRFINPHTP